MMLCWSYLVWLCSLVLIVGVVSAHVPCPISHVPEFLGPRLGVLEDTLAQCVLTKSIHLRLVHLSKTLRGMQPR